MKIYCSGALLGGLAWDTDLPFCYMPSFFPFTTKEWIKAAKNNFSLFNKRKLKMGNKVNLFLDSGAFSAKTKGIEINIQDYISFIKENEDYIDVYANLDVIGDAEATWVNQKIMENSGLHPLPVFHIGENISYLYKCMQYEYFCLGGIAKVSSQERRNWLDMCFNIICDSCDGTPKNKVHGFGMTSIEMMVRFPWFSVDSTSWVLIGRFGGVYIPQKKNGKYVYNENPFKINVSNRSPNTKQEGQHFSTMTKIEQKIILEYLEEKEFYIGKSEYRKENRKTYKLIKENERWANSADAGACRELIEEIGTFVPSDLLAMRDLVEIIIEPGLCNDYKKRDELNIIYFLDLENNLPKWPWAFKAKNKGGFGFK